MLLVLLSINGLRYREETGFEFLILMFTVNTFWGRAAQLLRC